MTHIQDNPNGWNHFFDEINKVCDIHVASRAAARVWRILSVCKAPVVALMSRDAKEMQASPALDLAV
jgi:hypothetical protein